MSLHRPFTPGDGDGVLVAVTPDNAGWKHCGLTVLQLEPGVPETVLTGDAECFVLPLAGSLTVSVSALAEPSTVEATVESGAVEPGTVEATFELQGRQSVFTRVTDFAYAGRDSVVVLTSAGGAEVALPSARCSRRLPPAYGPAEQVPVEVRGAGGATRQVTNFGTPGIWEHAEKLICCELITPPGNWSSYPPHKHDLTAPCPVVNEEIYYYRVAGPDQVTPSRDGFGLHVTTTGPEHEAAGLAPLDERLVVRDHDVVLVPYGYHGPCAAAPGYPLYYLNVLAGPGEARSMAFCDDPVHGWVRTSWDGVPLDPRCPVTSATGRVQPDDDPLPTPGSAR